MLACGSYSSDEFLRDFYHFDSIRILWFYLSGSTSSKAKRYLRERSAMGCARAVGIARPIVNDNGMEEPVKLNLDAVAFEEVENVLPPIHMGPSSVIYEALSG